MSSRQLFNRAVLIGGVFVLFSVAAYKMVPETAALYVVSPGILVGVMFATILAAANGNAHGAKEGVIWTVALIVNFFCYVGIAYVVLLVWFKPPKNASHETPS